MWPLVSDTSLDVATFDVRMSLGIVPATELLSSNAFGNNDIVGLTCRMRITRLVPACLISLFQISATSPLVQERDAPFESVRTRLDRDFSKSNDVESDKYFREARFASHYDGRFADRELGYEERRTRLRALIQTYLCKCANRLEGNSNYAVELQPLVLN